MKKFWCCTIMVSLSFACAGPSGNVSPTVPTTTFSSPEDLIAIPAEHVCGGPNYIWADPVSGWVTTAYRGWMDIRDYSATNLQIHTGQQIFYNTDDVIFYYTASGTYTVCGGFTDCEGHWNFGCAYPSIQVSTGGDPPPGGGGDFVKPLARGEMKRVH